jgi:transposase
MGCGSGMSSGAAFGDWQAAGVWDELHEVLLAHLRAADQIDWSRVQGDRGYDHDKCRRPLHAAGITTEIARPDQPHGSGLGKTRWVVERTISWLHNFRRLRIRFERLAFIHEAFLKLACCIICWRQLKNSFS